MLYPTIFETTSESRSVYFKLELSEITSEIVVFTVINRICRSEKLYLTKAPDSIALMAATVS